ncbi:hypothetical protein NDU88_007121 [Pleurodeles waltl]|uniref:Uncharacterized protein n=1 Tax=Pleurodeles waltl TaxID=8319 RepID=A0AAV7SRK3_PLEWA|nr:hypothetical protein NDU88_007121 [Pleurodeles waltl]
MLREDPAWSSSHERRTPWTRRCSSGSFWPLGGVAAIVSGIGPAAGVCRDADCALGLAAFPAVWCVPFTRPGDFPFAAFHQRIPGVTGWDPPLAWGDRCWCWGRLGPRADGEASRLSATIAEGPGGDGSRPLGQIEALLDCHLWGAPLCCDCAESCSWRGWWGPLAVWGTRRSALAPGLALILCLEGALSPALLGRVGSADPASGWSECPCWILPPPFWTVGSNYTERAESGGGLLRPAERGLGQLPAAGWWLGLAPACSCDAPCS